MAQIVNGCPFEHFEEFKGRVWGRELGQSGQITGTFSKVIVIGGI